jgi:hypothetical protein
LRASPRASHACPECGPSPIAASAWASAASWRPRDALTWASAKCASGESGALLDGGFEQRFGLLGPSRHAQQRTQLEARPWIGRIEREHLAQGRFGVAPARELPQDESVVVQRAGVAGLLREHALELCGCAGRVAPLFEDR